MIILIMYQVNLKYNGKSYDGGRDVQFKAVDSSKNSKLLWLTYLSDIREITLIFSPKKDLKQTFHPKKTFFKQNSFTS